MHFYENYTIKDTLTEYLNISLQMVHACTSGVLRLRVRMLSGKREAVDITGV